MKKEIPTPPLTPSTAHSLFPLSGTHWGTVLASAPVTQHFPHSTVSLPIAFASPPFACSFHLHEGNEQLPLKHKKKKDISLHLARDVPPSKTKHNSGFYIQYGDKIILISLTPHCYLFETYLLLGQKAIVLGTGSCCCH